MAVQGGALSAAVDRAREGTLNGRSQLCKHIVVRSCQRRLSRPEIYDKQSIFMGVHRTNKDLDASREQFHLLALAGLCFTLKYMEKHVFFHSVHEWDFSDQFP